MRISERRKKSVTVLWQAPGNVEHGRIVDGVNGPPYVERFAGKIIGARCHSCQQTTQTQAGLYQNTDRFVTDIGYRAGPVSVSSITEYVYGNVTCQISTQLTTPTVADAWVKRSVTSVIL